MKAVIKIVKTQVRGRDTRGEDRGKIPRLSFWLQGQNVIENLVNRGNEPWKLVKPLLKDVFEANDLTVAESGKVKWNRKAGCQCGCSPGFKLYGVTHKAYGSEFDVYLDVELTMEPEAIDADLDIGAGV